MPDRLTVEDLAQRAHEQEVEDAYRQGRRHGFQEAVSMGHAALDHLEGLRRDYGLPPLAGWTPNVTYKDGDRLTGALEGIVRVSEREGGCDSMLWGGRVFEGTHSLRHAQQDTEKERLEGLRRDHGLEPLQERCLCSDHWPEGYPEGEPRVSHARWQEANIQRDPLVPEREGGCDSILGHAQQETEKRNQ